MLLAEVRFPPRFTCSIFFMLQTRQCNSFKSLFLPVVGSDVGIGDWREVGGCYGTSQHYHSSP